MWTHRLVDQEIQLCVIKDVSSFLLSPLHISWCRLHHKDCSSLQWGMLPCFFMTRGRKRLGLSVILQEQGRTFSEASREPCLYLLARVRPDTHFWTSYWQGISDFSSFSLAIPWNWRIKGSTSPEARDCTREKLISEQNQDFYEKRRMNLYIG